MHLVILVCRGERTHDFQSPFDPQRRTANIEYSTYRGENNKVDLQIGQQQLIIVALVLDILRQGLICASDWGPPIRWVDGGRAPAEPGYCTGYGGPWWYFQLQ